MATNGVFNTVSKVNRLHSRWLTKTIVLVAVFGLACVVAFSALIAVQSYGLLRDQLALRVRVAEGFLPKQEQLSAQEYKSACIAALQLYGAEDEIRLQFADEDTLWLCMPDHLSEEEISLPEVYAAMLSGELTGGFGKDASTGRRIMAVAAPIVSQDGQVLGAIRAFAFTAETDKQVLLPCIAAFLVLIAVVLLIVIISNYYTSTTHRLLRSILDKAKRITAGSYGIQLQNTYEAEFKELVELLNEMSRKISESEKLQTEFISSLSHELRTPLTAITGWSETLLNSDELNEDTRRGVKIIHREAARLTEMVIELLEFTRIQDGRMTLNIENSDIQAEFEDTVFMYGSRLQQEGMTLIYEEPEALIPEIPCDPKRLRQVFLNILDNAATHAGEGKRINASISYENDHVVVRIRDYGPGLDEDEIPLVKKKFYKGSSKARGSGIGLAVCDEIVSMHSGELTLCNADGGGTLVTIILPVT